VTISKKTAALVAGGVIALGAGVGVAGLAAADPTPSPSGSPSASPSSGPSTGSVPDRDGRGGRHGGGFLDAAALAEKLGVGEDKVSQALQEIRNANRPSGTPSARPSAPPQQDRAERESALVKALAEKLGLDQAKVQAAVDELQTERAAERAAALKDRLDAAVDDGTLTRAEADAVTKAVEKGVLHG
jgi:biotin operon repressor